MKMTSKKGVVDGQEEGRIAVHVESEVVLSGRRVRRAVLDVKNDCFVKDTVNPDSMTGGRATYARVECSVCIPRRLSETP